jgi:hypothetical protein
MSNMKLYTTAAEIDKAILSFHSRGQALQSDAHKIACSVLAHVGEHGDIRVLAKFLNSFADMARVNAVRGWFEAFGPVTFKGNDPAYVKDGKTRLREAMETPFWKFRPEPEYVPLDAATALDKLIKRLQKDTEKTGADHSVTITALKAVPVSKTMTVQ